MPRWLLALGAGVFLLRTLLAPYGIFQADFQSWIAWGEELLRGPWATFDERVWHDRLPAVFYLLAALAAVRQTLPFLNTEFAYKLPANIADLAIAALVYQITARWRGSRWGSLAALLYLLNPFPWHISALWGQMDAVQAALMLGAVLLTTRQRPIWAAVVLTISALLKPHSIVIAPLLLMLHWRGAESRARALRGTAAAVVAGVITAALVAAPFVPPTLWAGQGPAAPLSYLARRLVTASEQYPYASVNAYNLWAALGALWQQDTQTFAGISWQLWGMLAFLLPTVFLLLVLARRRAPPTIHDALLAAATLSLLAFALLTRAHERHVFPFFAFAAPLVILHPAAAAGYLALSGSALINSIAAYTELQLRQPPLLTPLTLRLVSLVPLAVSTLFLWLTLRRKPISSRSSADGS